MSVMSQHQRVLMAGGVMLLALLGIAAASAEEPRDPFVDPRTVEVREEIKQKLIGILANGGPSLAIIGEAVVTVGDVICGWKVTQILPDRVTLQRNETAKTLSLGDTLTVDECPETHSADSLLTVP
jgi:hypothetical protein